MFNSETHELNSPNLIRFDSIRFKNFEKAERNRNFFVIFDDSFQNKPLDSMDFKEKEALITRVGFSRTELSKILKI
jgi:hypothetical protein